MQVRSSTLTAVFTALPLLLLVTVLISASLGQFEIPLPRLPGVFCATWGWRPPTLPCSWQMPPSGISAYPAFCWGCWWRRLGASGALMQAVFGNPLAEPGVIGISAGAAVGACGAVCWA